MVVHRWSYNIATVLFVSTVILAVSWSVVAVFNNSYVEDLPKIIILVLAGFSLAFIFDPIIARGSPLQRESRMTSKANVFAGTIINLAFATLWGGALLLAAVVVSIVFGLVNDLIRGTDITHLWAAGQFINIFVWVAVSFWFWTCWSTLCQHWPHLPEYMDTDVTCDGYYRHSTVMV